MILKILMNVESFAESVAGALEKYGNLIILRAYGSSEERIKYFIKEVDRAGERKRHNYILHHFLLRDEIDRISLLEKAVSMQNGQRVVLGVADCGNSFENLWVTDKRVFDVDLSYFESSD